MLTPVPTVLSKMMEKSFSLVRYHTSFARILKPSSMNIDRESNRNIHTVLSQSNVDLARLRSLTSSRSTSTSLSLSPVVSVVSSTSSRRSRTYQSGKLTPIPPLSSNRPSVCGDFLILNSHSQYSHHLISRTFFQSHPRCSNSEESSRTCWKCGGDTNPLHELFFCVCGVVQKPADELTYFDLFQTKQVYDLNEKSLGESYRAIQSRLHPDKFSTKSQQEQAFAVEQSALLNKAYSTLLKPLSRAIYMLELENVTIEENDSFSDPEFLMDIMTFNEMISSASTQDDVDQLYDMNEEKIKESISQISESFKNGKIPDARKFTIKLRYYTTIQERIKELRIKNLG